MQKACVIGADSFIGSRLTERLILEKHVPVRGLIHTWPHSSWVSRTTADIFQGDVNDRATLAEVMEGCDVVFHCVGIGGSWEQCQRVNVQGTKNVLEQAMIKNIKRVVYLSTVAVHGPCLAHHGDESAPLVRTGSPYADSKIEAEEWIWQKVNQDRMPVVIVRPTIVWGPVSRLFTVWPFEEIRKNRWHLVDHGRGTCNAVYIDNLIDALILAAEVLEAVGQAFIITDDQPCTWKDFYGHYARFLGKTTLPSVSSRRIKALHPLASAIKMTMDILARHYHLWKRCHLLPWLRPMYERGMKVSHWLAPMSPYEADRDRHIGILNISKAKTILGYVPGVSLEEGMRRCEEWLRDQHWR